MRQVAANVTCRAVVEQDNRERGTDGMGALILTLAIGAAIALGGILGGGS